MSWDLYEDEEIPVFRGHYHWYAYLATVTNHVLYFLSYHSGWRHRFSIVLAILQPEEPPF